MHDTRPFGFVMCTLSNAIKRKNDERISSSVDCEITRMQSWVIGYIARHSSEDVFQRDIENNFSIRRSTATGILQLMEKNGLLLRETVSHDARLKKLTLTPKALQINDTIARVLDEVDYETRNILTPQEQEIFLELAEKLIKGINNDCEKSEGSCSEQ